MPDYFVCTYGNFDGRKEIIEESWNKNFYQLHIAARYPSALGKIKQNDVILLKDGAWIIAHGVAKGAVSHDGPNSWKHQLHVEKWTKCEPAIHAYGIAWNTLCGGAMSLVKQVEEEWAKAKLTDTPKSLEGDDGYQVTCQNIPLKELLAKHLTIPDYQRGYCWRTSNVLDLIEGIHLWQQDNKNDEYHLGSVILKKSPSKDGFDIIDGQQRLTTLAIWAKLKNSMQENIPLLTQKLQNNNQTEHAIQSILRARDVIVASSNKICFDRIIISVIILRKNLPEDLAYTFFSNSNSTGKRLSDYDLLKTHHLRYVKEEAVAQKMSTRWHNLEKSGTQDELLHQMLYRLRNWRSRMNFRLNAANTPERDLFNHYAVSLKPLAGFPAFPTRRFRFDSILAGGREFFDYTEYYRKEFAEFNQEEVITKLHEALSWHSNGVIHAGINAAAFLFYCKFGVLYLSDAVYALAYRLSELRNETRVMSRYLSERIFQECVGILDRVTFEGEFFAAMLDNKQTYLIRNEKKTARNYWNALGHFLENLEKSKSLSIPQERYRSKSILKISPNKDTNTP